MPASFLKNAVAITTLFLLSFAFLKASANACTRLLIDVGNSSIACGIYKGSIEQCAFRCPTKEVTKALLAECFLRELKACGVPPESITQVGVTSVVPRVNEIIESVSFELFHQTPYFLTGETQDKIKILYRNPSEVGSDLIAGAIAAVERYPGKNCIVVDIGTATTVCAVNKDREFLGAVIFPGPRTSVQALARGTALLDSVTIKKPTAILADSTQGCIQAGIYYGQLATIEAVTKRIIEEHFGSNFSETIILGTGGFSSLFKDEHCFTQIIPDLNLLGVLYAIPG